MSGGRALGWQRRAHMGDELLVRRTAATIIFARYGKAEAAIDGTAHNIGIFIVLAVILPPADRAERKSVWRIQGKGTTAQAAGAFSLHAR